MEFEERKDTQLRNSFEELLNDVQNEELTYITVEKMFNKIMSHYSLAEGHIDNSTTRKEESRAKYTELREKKSVLEMMRESKVAPVELLQGIIDAYRNLDEVVVWQRLQVEVLYIFVKKLFNNYMATKTFEIHNAVEEGFEKRQEEWMNLTKENSQIMFTNVDAKFENFKMKLDESEKTLTDVEKKMMKFEIIFENFIEKQKKINLKINSPLTPEIPVPATPVAPVVPIVQPAQTPAPAQTIIEKVPQITEPKTTDPVEDTQITQLIKQGQERIDLERNKQINEKKTKKEMKEALRKEVLRDIKREERERLKKEEEEKAKNAFKQEPKGDISELEGM